MDHPNVYTQLQMLFKASCTCDVFVDLLVWILHFMEHCQQWCLCLDCRLL